MKNESWAAARKSLRIEAATVERVLEYLDEEAFGRAVDVCAKAERIITCASGSSGAATMKLSHSLCCIERPAKFMSPAEAVHGGLGCVQEGDVVIMVSRGGKTVELLPIIDVVKKKKAILIALTENLSSPLARQSDILIPMKIEQESDKLNSMATASYMTTVAIFDALLCALIEETGFTAEQFALIHPGGAVGERLNQPQ
ncbi:MAG: SIS domain-containing protein [Clostridiaceae bacterium]|jgi:D-arabinose 5-phosphate isomerase GutQ|nr:SIS domain-containing protein [Eubacteriales bacterium]NLV47370.1 SIS domain-containing protein [Clostridiaceae bacterium]